MPEDLKAMFKIAFFKPENEKEKSSMKIELLDVFPKVTEKLRSLNMLNHFIPDYHEMLIEMLAIYG